MTTCTKYIDVINDHIRGTSPLYHAPIQKLLTNSTATILKNTTGTLRGVTYSLGGIGVAGLTLSTLMESTPMQSIAGGIGAIGALAFGGISLYYAKWKTWDVDGLIYRTNQIMGRCLLNQANAAAVETYDNKQKIIKEKFLQSEGYKFKFNEEKFSEINNYYLGGEEAANGAKLLILYSVINPASSLCGERVYDYLNELKKLKTELKNPILLNYARILELKIHLFNNNLQQAYEILEDVLQQYSDTDFQMALTESIDKKIPGESLLQDLKGEIGNSILSCLKNKANTSPMPPLPLDIASKPALYGFGGFTFGSVFAAMFLPESLSAGVYALYSFGPGIVIGVGTFLYIRDKINRYYKYGPTDEVFKKIAYTDIKVKESCGTETIYLKYKDRKL